MLILKFKMFSFLIINIVVCSERGANGAKAKVKNERKTTPEEIRDEENQRMETSKKRSKCSTSIESYTIILIVQNRTISTILRLRQDRVAIFDPHPTSNSTTKNFQSYSSSVKFPESNEILSLKIFRYIRWNSENFSFDQFQEWSEAEEARDLERSFSVYLSRIPLDHSMCFFMCFQWSSKILNYHIDMIRS